MTNDGEKLKVLVTGGGGFIGSHVVDECLRRGYEVAIVDKDPRFHAKQKESLRENKLCGLDGGATLYHYDITNMAQLRLVFQTVAPDYVFHLAALPRVQYSIEHPEETHRVNVDGTHNVLLCAKEFGAKGVIYSASSSAYGDQDVMPLCEGMMPNPLSPYALQKYVGELLCRQFALHYGVKTVALRYFNVYGSRMDPAGAYALVIGRFLKLRKEGKAMTITGDGEQTRDFTHVMDVVNANLLAMEAIETGRAGAGEVVNIGYGHSASVNRIAELIGGPVEYIPARLEPKHTLANRTLAKKLLGWEPRVALEYGIEGLKKEWGL
ncbi:MAG: NAD-dependent epimerase/dehydratase family protein [Candidatus Niyogibacteria bacterium]|nr:NAD-dependent epimerase/dehydratase family protein [Candidatus Niyogibacteria bacterium]